MSRCSNRCPVPSPPAGLTDQAGRTHPRYRHLYEPGCQCALEQGHPEPHEADGGLLRWYDPPAIFVGGEKVG